MNKKKILRIATRKSPLAYWQANTIKEQLEKLFPFLTITLLPLLTEGDRQQNSSLSKLGGKGLFVKELEGALLNYQADIAVHSMKDLPMDLEEGLTLGAICKRDDPRDVLISRSDQALIQLSPESCVGTSSLRRQSQLLALRPDLQVSVLRGNIGTRIDKLAAGEFDAIILAAAGLIRLKKTDCISEYLETSCFLPAPGQGALGIECRVDDGESLTYISKLTHSDTYYCVLAERALSRELGGSCQVPIAAYAIMLSHGQLSLQALVGNLDGTKLIKVEKQGSIVEAEKIGFLAAQSLRDFGVEEILKEILNINS
ncbi:hydroxymethylbilane synthase [Rickettsiella endosymbiont of Litargus connexus]|uniref:hydroxymethylbilane synthase n=1 Tax=Rickettsiella endosymbiont of Litargus connexus TaxID=3066237 RepID=UPI0027EC8DD0|nr:hydroxymethylbilane synthase [Gammaproteobacteria bacterium]MDD4892551.1 hydroxymethylbilane synthase [Candidatus Rickettsiella isopodorum]MDD5161541.1 hydroxymethylbilane synthase [Candidatus Rickettsiella isopodorum]MDQ5899437.1 hydroxymethylbilane synthase [Pseudomonadota bacterium]